jgi:hypothetical protein
MRIGSGRSVGSSEQRIDALLDGKLQPPLAGENLTSFGSDSRKSGATSHSCPPRPA